MSPSQIRQTLRAWEQFFAGKDSALEAVRPVIRDSWRRCQQRGVDPTIRRAPIVLSREEVDELRGEVFYEAASPFVRLLCDTFSGSYFLVAITDSECRILALTGHPEAVSSAERINGVVGSQWLEHQVGTDSLGTSAVLGTPLQVHWCEHYCEFSRQWVGNTAPVRGFAKHVAGLVNLCLSDRADSAHHSAALNVVTKSARMIEDLLKEKELARRVPVFERYGEYQNRHPNDLVVGTDAAGVILVASPGLASRCGLSSKNPVGHRFHDLVGVGLDEVDLARKLRVLESPQEIHVETRRGERIELILIPVRHNDAIVGSIAIVSAPWAPPRHRQSAWGASYHFTDIVGESSNLVSCVAAAQKVAEETLPVLIMGESGTGKELFAHAIHNASRRWSPFVPVTCGQMNEELLGAELFGYVDGAFTGAARGGRPGKMELADGGTLFLDEVEEMPPKMQIQLLRVLEEGRVVRIGGDKPKPIDVRIIAATNARLDARVTEGRLRPDLYYRLNVHRLVLPPLRERKVDIPLLAKRLLAGHRDVREISDGALGKLEAYDWPGNVRELRNVLLQGADQAVGGIITEGDLPQLAGLYTSQTELGASRAPEAPQARGETALEQAEREAILRALKSCSGNIARAARELGIRRGTLYRKMEKHGVRGERLWH